MPLFEIRQLAFTYPDGTPALRNISLDIHHGDRIALVGHNGSGKTTLIKHLGGLLQPQSGTVRYKGEPVTGDTATLLRQEVGILFQDPDDQLFCNTLYEDVAFGPMNQGLPKPVVEKRVSEALRAVDLADYAYKPPHNLSYGQRKRAALATVLAMNPVVLILDEPTANLDPRQVQHFGELLRRFTGTIICITHDILFLQELCNRAVVLADGRVHHDYSFDDLIAHPASLRDHGLDFSFRFSCCGVTGQGGAPSYAEVATSRTGYLVAGRPRCKEEARAAYWELRKRADDAADGVPCDQIRCGGERHEHDGQPSPPPAADNGKVVLGLRHCSYTYPDGTPALRDVSLTVRRGERIALVGENGAGKSTLAGVMLGTLEAGGEVYFEEKKVDAKLRRRLWRKVGIVFQDAADQLFCPSCQEEVAFGPERLGLSRREVADRVAEALAMVRLTGYENRVPLNMSGGERKRLAIAAVLSMRPEVLILDEPTAGLDPRGEELLLTILAKLPMTMILITHDLFFINALTQRTVVMHQGKIIRDYRTADFLADEHLEEASGIGYIYRNNCHPAC